MDENAGARVRETRSKQGLFCMEIADATVVSLISTAFSLAHLVIAVIKQTSHSCVGVFSLTWDLLFEWGKWFSIFSMCFFLKAAQDLCRAAAVSQQSLQ